MPMLSPTTSPIINLLLLLLGQTSPFLGLAAQLQPSPKATVSSSINPRKAVPSTPADGSTSATTARAITNNQPAPVAKGPNKIPPASPTGVTTPINPKALSILLQGYPDDEKEYLINGFTNGFLIPFKGPIPPLCQKNLPSATKHPQVIQNKLEKEIFKGRIAGPFIKPPLPDFIVSPLGVVPKKTPGEFRVIHHESYPSGSSVNDGIPKSLTSVHYATLQNAVQHIKSFGPSCFLAKTDIQDAFWIIPIHPDSYHLTGIFWQGQYYYLKSLPMGSSISCSIFERFSTALEWIAQNKLGIAATVHILDDFLFINSSFSFCQGDLQRFQKMCTLLGVPLAPEKTVGPSTCLPFVGIELDTIQSEARLPPDKIEKCQEQISSMLNSSKATLRSFQSVIGLLNFACQVVLPGRPFLRRLIDRTMGIRHPHFQVRVTKDCKKDLRTWLKFLQRYNGRTFFLQEKILLSPHLNLYTDAAGSWGFSGIYGTRWFYGKWSTPQEKTNIAVLELYPIVVAVNLYGHSMANHCITFISDNEAVVAVINKATSKHQQIMALVRPLVLACLQHNILFKARHIPGVLNVLADSLSRLQVQRFKELAPWAKPSPDPIPTQLQLKVLLAENE